MAFLNDYVNYRFLRLVAPLALAQIISWGTLVYSFPLFLEPMEADLGWSRTELTGAYSLSLIVAALCAFPVGWWIDRHGGRLPMTLGSIAAALLLYAWSEVSAIWQFYAIWVGIGVAMGATLYEPVFAVLVHAFRDNARQSITLMTLIAGFAGTVFYPTSQVLIDLLGWREALIALALFNLLCCGGIHGFVLRNGRSRQSATAEPQASAEAAGSPAKPASPIKAALKLPVFWLLAVAFTANSLILSALVIHAIPLLIERGVGTALVITVVAFNGPMQVVGRLIFVFVERWIDFTWSGVITLALPLGAVVLLMVVGSGSIWLFAYPLLYGTAAGIATIIRASAVPEFIGPEGYGAINGALSVPATVARAGGPTLAAIVWAASGGYDLVLWLMLPIAGLSILAFLIAVRYRVA